MNIVIKSLEYYDNNYGKYDHFISKVKYYEIIHKEGDMERNILVFRDKNKKEIFRSGIEYLGSYYPSSKLWVWSWANPINPKNRTYITKKILDYGMNICPVKNKKNLFLRTELITSRFRITDPVQLDIHVAISSYLSKMPYIFKLHWYGEDQPKLPEYHMYSDRKPLQILYLFLLDHEKLKRIKD